MTETALAVRQTTIKTYDDVERAAGAMAKSGYFQDSRDMAQAVVKILAGQEMGFGAFASMTGIHIIQGRPSIGANLMASAVKRSGRYNYRVTEMTDKNCSIDFFEGREKIGTSSFSLDEAKKAGTKNLDKFPRNMLFARAMSNGVRWYCPDVFNGSAVYTPEELGANVNEDGEVISGSFVQAPQTQPTMQETALDLGGKITYSEPDEPPAEDSPFDEPPAPVAPPKQSMSYEMAATVKNRDGVPYTDIPSDKLTHMSRTIAKAIKENGLDPEAKSEHLFKLDAIAVILQSRSAQ